MDSSLTRIAVVAISSALIGACSLTPTQKKWVGVGLTVLAVGAIKAHDEDSGRVLVEQRTPTPNVDCASNPQLCR